MSILAREALDAMLKSNRLGEHIRILQTTIDRLWPDWDAAKTEGERLWLSLDQADKQTVLDLHREVSDIEAVVNGRPGTVEFAGTLEPIACIPASGSHVDAHGDEF